MGINVTLSCDPTAQEDVESVLSQEISVKDMARMISSPSFELMDIPEAIWEKIRCVVENDDRESFSSLLQAVSIMVKESILCRMFSSCAGREIRITVNVDMNESGGLRNN